MMGEPYDIQREMKYKNVWIKALHHPIYYFSNHRVDPGLIT